VEKLDLPVVKMDLGGKALNLGSERQHFFDGIGEQVCQPSRLFAHGPEVIQEPWAFEATLKKPLFAVKKKFLLFLAEVGTVLDADMLLLPASARFHAVHRMSDLENGLHVKIRHSISVLPSIAMVEKGLEASGQEGRIRT
jgi:hypothetical protein